MPELSDEKLAEELRTAYERNPDLTLQEAAEQIGVPEEQAHRVLDSYRVEDGAATHAGEGRGGGWVPEAEPEEAEQA